VGTLGASDRHCLDYDRAIWSAGQGWMSQGGCGKLEKFCEGLVRSGSSFARPDSRGRLSPHGHLCERASRLFGNALRGCRWGSLAGILRLRIGFRFAKANAPLRM